MQLTTAVLGAAEALDLRVTLCCVRWPIAAPLVCKQLAALAGLLLARCCLLLLRMAAGCALPGREVRQLLVFLCARSQAQKCGCCSASQSSPMPSAMFHMQAGVLSSVAKSRACI
jgi:hypothetical protein